MVGVRFRQRQGQREIDWGGRLEWSPEARYGASGG
jgi:hypothetical protein